MNLYFNTNKIGYSQNSKISDKKSVKKKDVSEVLTEENIEKMRQIAYNDAVKGKRGQEAIIFRNQCREKVAHDRKMIFANAEKGMSAEIDKFKTPENIWIYLLETDGHFDGGSFKGNYTRTGNHTFIDAFDENGEKVGIYDSNYGWRTNHTSAEKQVMATLAGVYNETFNSVYKAVHKSKNTSDVPFETKSTIDISV